MASVRKLGWRPDLPDFRDHHVKWGDSFMKVGTLPSKYDQRAQCSTIENQGQISACTGNAIVGALEVLENKNGAASASFAVTTATEMVADKADSEFIDLSRLFVYWNERNLEGTVNEDAGAYIRDGIKVVASLGVCAEKLWPYDETRWSERPSHAAFVEATKHRITEYARVEQSAYQIKTVLASGFPIVFGMSVYDSFLGDAVASTGVVPMPTAAESCQGGHAVLAVGYDDDKQAVLVRNSWGADWGLGGYFWLPYDYITNTGLASDLWVVRH
jgi:C1A family cysteine protease